MAIAANAEGSHSQPRPLCHIQLDGQTCRSGVEYNDHGQVLVVCDSNLYIITPAMGFHPSMKQGDPHIAASTYDWLLYRVKDAMPADEPPTDPKHKANVPPPPRPLLDHYIYKLPVSTLRPELERTAHTARPITEHDWEAAAAPISLPPSFLCYKAAKWSPKGLGPNGSCIIATVDSDFEVKIVHAEGNAYKGPYTVVDSPDATVPSSSTSTTRRHKTLASQVLDVAWSPDVGRKASSSTRPVPLCVLAAGTRSGEVLLWTRWRQGEHLCGEESPVRLQVGRRAVTAVQWTKGVEIHDDGSSKLQLIATLAGRGPKVVEVRVQVADGVDEVTCNAAAAAVQPPNLFGSPEVALTQLEAGRNGQLAMVAASPGQAHVWHCDRVASAPESETLIEDTTPRGDWTTFRLLGEYEAMSEAAREWDARSPHAQAVALARLPGEEAVLLTLSSGLQYRVPLTSSGGRDASTPQALHPLKAKATTVCVSPDDDVVLESLLQQVEARKTLNGWDSDGDDGDQKRLQLRVAVQSDDDIKAYQSLLNKKSRFTMMMQLPAAGADGADVLTRCVHQYTRAIHQGLDNEEDKTTVHALRPSFALYYAAILAAGEDRAMSVRWRLLDALRNELERLVSDATSPTGRLLYLASWALREARGPRVDGYSSHLVDAASAALGDSFEDFQTRLLASTLVKTIIAQLAQQPLSLAVAKVVKDVLAKNQGHDWRADLFRQLEGAIAGTSASEGPQEICPACEAPVPLPSFAPSEDEAKANNDVTKLLGQLDTARCERGHIWKRSSVTFGLLAGDVRVRTCTGCGAKEAKGGSSSGGVGEEDVVAPVDGKGDALCRRCGNAWVS